jgi:hypothetical protein
MSRPKSEGPWLIMNAETPPDPAGAAITEAVAKGILDADALARVRTAAEVARIPRKATKPGERPLSEVLAELREDER